MNLFTVLTDRAARLDTRLDRFAFLGSVRSGLALMTPFLLIGSFALVIASFPLPAYQRAMQQLFGDGWTSPLHAVFKASFGILSVIMTLSVSYISAGNSDKGLNRINPMIAAIVSLCSFMLLSGFGSSGFDPASLGVTGLLTAVVVSVISSKLFASLCSIDALAIRTYADGAHTAFNDAVRSMVPAAITISMFLAAHEVLERTLGSSSLQHFVSGHLTNLFLPMGATLASAILFILLIHLFWSVGIHGNNIMEPVALAVFVPALAANTAAIPGGPGHPVVFTKTFFDTFVLMGGCGSTLCLVIAIFVTARRKSLRRHAKLSLLPVLFNINELVVFGLPIVFNPLYIVPFVATPLVLTLTSYAATVSGIVPYTSHPSEWTTPVILGGWIATGSFAGSILQLVNLTLGTLVFIPFVRLAERKSAAKMEKSIAGIGEVLDEANRVSPPVLLSRKDKLGNISRSLAVDLANDLRASKLHLVYQPQVGCDGTLHGAEALLRWNHPVCGAIPPQIALALAEEARFEEELAAWIIETSCRDMSMLFAETSSRMEISINVSARQLDGGVFVSNLMTSMTKHGIRPHQLKLEITEKDALSGSRETLKQMSEIRKLGIKLAMDDFGMGHSSLMYLKEYEFDTIKIDGALVKELMTNPNCGGIIASIVSLGSSLGFSVIAEYVETQAQRDRLHELGCDIYQGYCYSKPLQIEEFCVYARLPRR